MKELEEIDFDDTTKGFTKKELLIQKRELVKLHKTLGGIRNLTKTPSSAIWVVDAKREHLAVNEATKLGIPVIGILDTNADPDELQYPIPGNDDAIRSVGLLTRIIADAAAEGLIQRHQTAPKPRATSAPSSRSPSGSASCSQASETPQSTAEKIEAVDGAVDRARAAAEAEAVAEVVAAETPTEENDADAAASPSTRPPPTRPSCSQHHPRPTTLTEAKIEAEEAEPTRRPTKAAAKKPGRQEGRPPPRSRAAEKPAAEKPAAEVTPPRQAK